MCTLIRSVTVALLALPVLFLVCSFLGPSFLLAPAIVLLAIYAWVWLLLRPTHFVVRQDVLEVIWPLKRRQIRRANISHVRTINRRDLKREVGWGVRVGAGGLWGGFGWLWTQRQGIVQMYISRINDLVWIECTSGRPWLISPEQPHLFIQAMAAAQTAAAQKKVPPWR
jgi:hypothetical protein